MRSRYFTFARQGGRTPLDPRAKLLLLVAINVVMFGAGYEGVDCALRLICAAVPLFALLAVGRRRAALWYCAVYALVLPLETLVLPHARGLFSFVLLMATGMFSRLLAGCAFAYYMMGSTTVGEFLTAMRRMRAPDAITIPLAVMFRFFPTLAEEARAIREAMTMRGMGPGDALRHPLAHLEYGIVPLMMSTLRIGDELAAAALTKGLDSGRPRTHLGDIRMRPRDWALSALALALLAYMFARHSLL